MTGNKKEKKEVLKNDKVVVMGMGTSKKAIDAMMKTENNMKKNGIVKL